MNPAIIFEAHHKLMLSYDQRILLRRKRKNVIEKIWKILENHQSTSRHALNVFTIQTLYVIAMNARLQT